MSNKIYGSHTVEITLIVVAALTFVVGGVGLLQNVKPAHAQTNLLPNIYAYAAVTTAQQLVAPNATRRALQICNAGGTNVLWIAPQGNTINTGAAVVPAANAAGSVGVPVATGGGVVTCFSPPVNAPSIGQGWNGFSTTTPVTVYEY